MKNWIILIFVVFVLSFTAKAKVDPYNTYQWNRPDNQSRNWNKPWFEWWYYKVVIPETNEAFYFVYGVVNPWDSEHKLKATRAYVGMGDFVARKTVDQNFNVSDFSAAYDETRVNVAGHNEATDKRAYGEIFNEEGESFAWNFSIEKKWSFDATGWATGKNLTNIEWYSAQADASCTGEVLSHGKLYKFKNTPCYQDRNWGTSFPKWWTWIVSNHFEGHPDTALSVGGGNPILLNMRWPKIEGVAVGLKHKGVEYTFRPNDLNPVKIDIRFGRWEVEARNSKYKVEISAYAPKESFLDLQFMTPQGQVFHDYEALTGEVTVKLYKKKRARLGRIGKTSYQLIDTLKSYHAGIEYGSNEIYQLDLKSLFQKSYIHLQ